MRKMTLIRVFTLLASIGAALQAADLVGPK
ncbi:MAG: hypothetical protein QOG29_756 [Gaiellaceae bacterium]|jgi:hypothetical protein|nr:hypothetical protein [Gaiellaceae bacterium]MDX6483544.1 hypothetical protein [Gaiellaceae bacterium]MDX6492600.1 hypothetical protein [Gaiellaceae bacterium]MDX6509424.1 hypothetical protein [Gaiellaceae bacterium]MDX6543346.1 hypothetical protein [Gaiellaceae bacterium]